MNSVNGFLVFQVLRTAGHHNKNMEVFDNGVLGVSLSALAHNAVRLFEATL